MGVAILAADLSECRSTEMLRSMAVEFSRDAGEAVRVWRTSHTGGHRFAPTLIDLPDGRYWGRLDACSAGEILRRQGDPQSVEGLYRGWSALSSAAEQSAEGAALARFGWKWQGRVGRIETLDTTAGEAKRTVRLETGQHSGGEAENLTVTVECAGAIPTMNCMKRGSKGDNPQYRVID